MGDNIINRNNVTDRYYIKGEIKLLSPMIIGSGGNEVADLQIIRDWNDKIFIPATTIAGNIRHFLEKKLKNKDKLEKYFGSKDEKSGHSLFSFFDATELSVSTDIRDGVKLDNLTKTTEDGSKYDYEIINKGSTFNFRMEIVAREKTNNGELEAIASKITSALECEELRIGAKTSRGFGRIKLSNTKIQKIDIINERQKWIDFSWDNVDSNFTLHDISEMFSNINPFHITAEFLIPDSLIIKSYSTDPNDVDAVSLTSNGEPIISGTSWNGAIRHSLENVGREIGKHKEMLKLIKQTFGWVDDKNKTKSAVPSRVIIDESIIENSKSLTYVRNKVDRFTGGVVDGALFDEKPVYGGTVTLRCELPADAKDYEKGMLVLAIKELQNGIQTVGGGGNIGRGRLNGGSFIISKDEDSKFLNALANKLNGGEDE